MATNDLLCDEASLSKTSTIPQVNPPTILKTRQKNVSDFDKLKEKSENNLDDQNNGTKINYDRRNHYPSHVGRLSKISFAASEKISNDNAYNFRRLSKISFGTARSRSQDEPKLGPLEWLKLNSNWPNDSIFGTKGNGQTSLHVACQNQAPLYIVNALLDELDKNSINAQDNDFKNTVLHDACWFQCPLAIIELLLDHLERKVINVANNFGQTALHLACMKGAKAEVLHTLITHKNGKKLPSARNAAGKLPFDIFPHDVLERESHLKNLLVLHTLMMKEDPTGSNYPRGLFTSMVHLSSEDKNHFANHPYLQRALNTDVVKPFALSILIVDVIVQLVVTVIFSFYMSYDDSGRTCQGYKCREISSGSFVLLGICLFGTLGREMAQFYTSGIRSYSGDLSNMVDLIQITVLISVFVKCSGDGTINPYHLLICIAVAWTRLLFVTANLNPKVAVFVDAFLVVIRKMIPFAYVVLLICFAFAHMYELFLDIPDITEFCANDKDGLKRKIWEDGEKQWLCDLENKNITSDNYRETRTSITYFYTFNMALSNDWSFLQKFHGPLTILSMAFALLVGLVLMNMLIALISNQYTEVEKQSQTSFWVHRLLYIDELNSLYSISSRFRSCFLSMSSLKSSKRVRYSEGNLESDEEDIDTQHFDTNMALLPDRMDMNQYHEKNINAWQSIEKYENVTRWFWQMGSGDTYSRPNFLERVSAFLVMAKWSDILAVSISFRKIVLGLKYMDNTFTAKTSCLAWMQCSVILLYVYVRALIMAPLGFITGGYFWAREVKEYMFYGEVNKKNLEITHESNSLDDVVKSNINKILVGQEEMEDSLYTMYETNTELKAQVYDIKEQNVDLKVQIDSLNSLVHEIKTQNVELKAQISKLSDVVLDRKTSG